MEKETIEEAAENHQKGGYEWQKEKRMSFIEGAKWQAEQAITYTHEEVEFIKRAVQEYWEHCFAELPDKQNDLKLTQQILNK